MATFLTLATAAAGDDLQPLVSATLAIRERSHRAVFLGDASVERAVRRFGLEVEVLECANDPDNVFRVSHNITP